MKLVFKYTIEGDQYTSPEYDIVLPIEYSSKEDCVKDFEIELDKAIKQNAYNFYFGAVVFCLDEFYDKKSKKLPEILTIDEWFANENIYP